MRLPATQRFSKTLFLVTLTVSIGVGGAAIYLYSDTAGAFVRGAIWLVVTALALSTVVGLSPWLYRLARTRAHHFAEMLQARIAEKVVINRLRELRIAMRIKGITNFNGTVAFSFQPPGPNTVGIGTHLDVVVEHSQERWGAVEVVSAEPNAYLAIPFDRANEDFFASLEDRMNIDPSAPEGVILIRTVPPELEEFIHELFRKGG